MKRICHNHCPEHAHIIRFYLYYVCCKNFESEHGGKSRSGFGEEILSHLRELRQVLHMVGFVSWCWTFFMLWVFINKPGIRMFEWWNKARVFLIFSGQRLKKGYMGWACFVFPFHTIQLLLNPLSPFGLFLMFFDFFFFGLTYLFFLMILKI